LAIIVVGGSSRGAGKTALVCGLIAALQEFRWTAVKITTHDHGLAKPIWEETTAGQGTDTGRYLAAGAQRALLATPLLLTRGPVADFPTLLNGIRARLGRGADLIFESNSVVNHVKPDLCLAVHGSLDHARNKPSFSYVVQCADAMVAHSDADRMVGGNENTKPVFHLAALERISPEMLGWVRLKLGGGAR
jgi:hypothetical protein